MTKTKFIRAVKSLIDDDYLELYFEGKRYGSIFYYDGIGKDIENFEINDCRGHILLVTDLANIQIDKIVERSL